MTDLSIATTVGDAVARDLRSVAVFARHGIDFNRGGRRSIDDACRNAGVDAGIVVDELAALFAGAADPDDLSSWPPLKVLDRILGHHHAYVRSHIPLIAGYLDELNDKCGRGHPELERIRTVFNDLSRELLHHMDKEERILFPYIRAMLAAHAVQAPIPPTPFGTIQNPVRMMEAEHQHTGEDLWYLRSLTDGFKPPADACPIWQTCYAELEQFERDLHEHVHLENTVLFPAAASLEVESSPCSGVHLPRLAQP